MSPLIAAFGEAVRHLRKEKGLSQESLAGLAGVHRTYVGMIERGEKNITLENIHKFARALSTSTHDLLRMAEERI
jgi:transcriptional regulator with XRE-family HTH domain